MGKITIKSSDALKWGFLGQIGRSAGKDAYNYAKKSLFTDEYVDTSSVDASKLGETDSEGHFTYNGYEHTSVGEYIGWLIGITLLPPIIAPILFLKALYRLIRHSVRFVDLYDCPVRKKDRRARNGMRYLGTETIKFVYRKPFDEAINGIQVNNKPNKAVLHTKIDIALYFVLAIVGFCWFGYVHNKMQIAEEKESIEKEVALQRLTHWTDTTFVDNFTQASTSIRYVLPTKQGKLYPDFVLIKQNRSYYFFSKTSYLFDKDDTDIKLFDKGSIILGKIGDYDFLLDEKKRIELDLGIYRKHTYPYRHNIPQKIKSRIPSCDSIQVRADGIVYTIHCK